MIRPITGTRDFAEYLRGKKAHFLLSMSTTATAEIPGITQAGIPGLLHLTPTLDAEFLCTGEVRSLDAVAETPSGVPTPALITRAVHLLHPFAEIGLLDLGLSEKPKVERFACYGFDIPPSGSIDTGARIAAMEVFERGVAFAQTFEPKGDYLILGESIPGGTTTAAATALALGYDAQEMFSSSFKNAPQSTKRRVIEQALTGCEGVNDLFERLAKVSDNMLLFNAGFLLGLQNRDVTTVLAGGTQMAAVLLIVDTILRSMEGSIREGSLALWTTAWLADDPSSDIAGLLRMLSFPIDACCAEFDFSRSSHPALRLYDEGEAKEGVGAGAALVYGILNGLSPEQITRRVEGFLS
ncbi:TIGR00303 family protein [Sulfuricurvum sp. IAE1]|uniref:nicotinate mononucleotide-dependent phosphoribosyltransferase CobT n=1 Tax=Sulfuricurvum sp. IAE1 TaxID=2546102 RepID=UPI0010431FDF|nr:TIGR00303 family protein [Sulfuricurvum sp. IAE1]TDA68477.1 TIGR00303 family protein [Sulfuricurvum sp. IAE1]